VLKYAALRGRALAGPTMARRVATRVVNLLHSAAWLAALTVRSDPVEIAAMGPLLGSIRCDGLL